MKSIILKGSMLAAAVAIPAVGFASTVSAAPSNDSTIFQRVAEILNVKQDDLSSAFKTAAIEEVDQRVKDGNLTQDKATQIKERINNSEGFEFFGPRHRKGDHLKYLSTFLNKSEDELKAAKEDGKTINDLLTEAGKTHEDFANYVYDQRVKEVQAKVQSGDLTQEEATKILERMKERHEEVLEKIKSGEFPGEKGTDDDGPKWL